MFINKWPRSDISGFTSQKYHPLLVVFENKYVPSSYPWGHHAHCIVRDISESLPGNLQSSYNSNREISTIPPQVYASTSSL